MARSRALYVIDFDGLSSDLARLSFPEAYNRVLEKVKPERDHNNEPYRRDNWWLFGRRNSLMRDFVADCDRYIVTCETSKHRVFQFLDGKYLSDNMIVCIGTPDATVLSVLSSRMHTLWATASGGWLGVGNDPRYSKSRCFDPFPFPDPPESLKARLRAAGEELDATRKKVQAEHPDLTLTGLYNVLEKIKAGTPLSDKDEDVKRRGLVLILKELHETIDRLTADAYGWPHDLTDEQILERLVALNAERAKEEAAGHVRWLRPDYQIPRFAKGAAAKTGELDLGPKVVAIDAGLPPFPTDRYEQPLAIEALLLATGRSMDAAEMSRAFKRGGERIEQRVTQVLTTLVRYGRVTTTGDGRFVARKAA